MSNALTRVAGLFVAPADTPAFAPPRPRPMVTGVLVAEPDLLVAAGGIAAAMRREARAATALVCAWRGHDDPILPPPAPGSPGAARLASKLARRDLAARACGTLCVVELPSDGDDAVAAFRDACAAADGPVVLALARRDPAVDALLAGADRLVLAATGSADQVLAELAFGGLLRLGLPVQRLPVPTGLLARQAARIGLAALVAPTPREVPPAALQESLS